ncbi:MAG: NADH-ubiquinone oxidoreductase-F iron-sulfur binding region domain-containing protein [Actinomycetes bacterium]
MTVDTGADNMLHSDQLPKPGAADPRAISVLALYPSDSAEHSYGSRREDLRDHLTRFAGPSLLARSRDRSLVELIDTANITGHGGGHFPVARKWQAVLDLGGPVTVIANGAEGEPLSAKDAALLQLRPHQVLDGAQLAAGVTKAHQIIFWLHASAAASRYSIENALRERTVAGFRELPVRIMMGPDRYLSGEMTAVARGVAGGPALPTYQPVPGPPVDQHGNIKLIHNVETLAKVAQVAFGGTSPARLLTIFTGNARVVAAAGPRVTIGSAIAQAHQAVGVPPHPLQAVLLGGYGGQWVPWHAAADLPVAEHELRKRGLSLGAGVVAPLAADTCGVRQSAAVFRYLADGSARQCGPCMFGLPATAELLDELAFHKMRRSEARRMDKYMEQLVKRGACAHPDGAIRMLTSALDTFSEDVASHKRSGRCLHSGNGPAFPIPSAS